MQIRWLPGIGEIAAAQWNAIAPDYPFLRHEFLQALESTGCVAPATGWTPRHLAIYEGEELVAAAPLYAKSHSWGEFVFDFSWARAFEGRGIDYYPKLVLAVPFTPATGPRLLLHPAWPAVALQRVVLDAVVQLARAETLSSAHALFIDDALRETAHDNGWLLRSDCQFRWYNRGYRDYEDYLAGFSAEKRKKARRERRRIAELGIEFRTLSGSALDERSLQRVYDFHAATFHRHGHEPYLSLECFAALAATMGDSMLVKLALLRGEAVAAAVYFRSATTLYGRYWGAAADFHSLHFEACYHQGIEYCIEQGLQQFEPGTQGEHKLARGFEPVLTWSAHWIADAALRSAIAAWLQREAQAVRGYAAAAAEHTPFRHGERSDDPNRRLPPAGIP